MIKAGSLPPRNGRRFVSGSAGRMPGHGLASRLVRARPGADPRPEAGRARRSSTQPGAAGGVLKYAVIAAVIARSCDVRSDD